MSKQDMMKIQNCVLKVNIHCEGCEQKVKKLLQKTEGVYSVSIDAEQGKVMVSGQVDPAKLIKKLKRSGKHAELWGGQRGMNNNNMMYNQNYLTPQFRNMQIDNSKKGGKDNNKSMNQKGQKGSGGGGVQSAHFQNIKGGKDFKVLASKDKKSVKFNLSEDEFDESDDGLDDFDDYDEFDDDFDDDYDEDEDEEEEHGHSHGHGHAMHNNNKMMMPMMANGRGPQGIMNGLAMNNHKGKGGGGGENYGGGKKGDVIDLPIQMKGKVGNFINEVKNGNGGKKSSGEGGKNNKGEKHKGDGDNKNNKKKNAKGKSGGGGGGFLVKFLGLGKKNKKGGANDTTNKNKNQGGGGNNNNKGKDGKKGGGGGKLDKVEFDFQDFDFPVSGKNGKGGKVNNNNGHHGGGKNNNGNMGQMMGPMGQRGGGSMNQMGPMGGQLGPMDDHHMRNVQAVQGLPASAAMNGGYYQGMHMQPNPYNNMMQQQQQQYMAMMMNQQQQQQQSNMNMYPPQHMMYGRPHPSMNYMPPPPMPSHPMADPITHVFSDENTESCSIM